MSVGPFGGVLGSAAGAPLSQTRGSESERAARESAAQDRRADGEQRSEKAAGVGQTEEDQETSDRDADGRRLWEAPAEGEATSESPDDQQHQPQRVKDPKGEAGNTLDLMG